MMPAALLVDLDGTLYHPLPVKVAMAFALRAAPRQHMQIISRFRKEHEAVRGMRYDDSPFEEQLRRTSRATGLPVSEVEEVIRQWMIERPGPYLRRFERKPLVAALREAQRRGALLALVSDYPAMTKLEAMDLVSLFDVVVAPREDRAPHALKPDPEGYALAMEILQVSAERCLIIGDRDDADGGAAKTLGVRYAPAHRAHRELAKG